VACCRWAWNSKEPNYCGWSPMPGEQRRGPRLVKAQCARTVAAALSCKARGESPGRPTPSGASSPPEHIYKAIMQT
jgi:hypothetical protein